MPFSLDQVVPWGRSFAEYERMFALTPADLQRPILGCADGPASFNAEAATHGTSVISVDPLYTCEADEIRRRIKQACPQVLEQTQQNRDDFVWNEFKSIEELGRARLRAMVSFLADYPTGRKSGRYVAAELPRLPFEHDSFPLALCSHFLFLYGDQLGEQFHVESVVELCRVAAEVRIFPLVGLDNAPSPHVSAVIRAVEQLGRKVQIERVAYEFQRGGNEMMRIVHR
ncbi:MAG TPA: hypothetical protein VHE81_11220 [Lacipirellulaceae bacterium]|nr:hypothetical protein [Lacipirellulaceae bacterium]